MRTAGKGRKLPNAPGRVCDVPALGGAVLDYADPTGWLREWGETATVAMTCLLG